MPTLVDLKTFTDDRGNLTVLEKVFSFDIKRVFYIYGVNDSIRGRHRHHKTIQAAISIQGSCKIYNKSSEFSEEEIFLLNKPSTCLIIEPTDYHWMTEFSPDCILMVFASEYYDYNDYIFEPY
jgi:hypothetical protein